MSVATELASVPFGDMITSLGAGIAQAQFELDKSSAAIARMMSGVDPEDRVQFGGQSLSLIELGFTPTFYQFVESTIEVKIVVNMTKSSSNEVKSNTKSNSLEFKSNYIWWRPNASITATTRTVDAKYSNKYDYSVEGSSIMRTKLVPVPPPAILEDRIRVLMEEEANVNYQKELRRLRIIHRPAILTAIANWTKAMDSEAVIETRGDLERSIFAQNPALLNILKAYPEIIIDPTIGQAISSKFSNYITSKRQMEDDILALEGSSSLPDTEIYINQAAAQREFVTNLAQDTGSTLHAQLMNHKDFLEKPAFLSMIGRIFDNYLDELGTKLVEKISNLTGGNLDLKDPEDVIKEALDVETALENQISPHPDIKTSSKVQEEATNKFITLLSVAVISEYNSWPFPTDGIYESQRDLLDRFLTEKNLEQRFINFPKLYFELAETEISKHKDYLDDVADQLEDAITNWSPSSDAKLTNPILAQNNFFLTHQELDVRKTDLAPFLEAASIKKKMDTVSLINFFHEWKPTSQEAEKINGMNTIERRKKLAENIFKAIALKEGWQDALFDEVKIEKDFTDIRNDLVTEIRAAAQAQAAIDVE